MREKYESLALADLKAIAKARGLKGTSAMKKATLKAEATCGLWFGGFQMLMPIIGYFLGSTSL